MSIGFLATGDEIILGDTLNTNTQQLAHALAAEGFAIGQHLATSDDEADMLSALQFLAKHHDTIVITGGLSPTSDDRTRFVVARFLNEPLIEFPEAMAHIKMRMTKAAVSLQAGNEQQALFPKLAELLPNPHGSAMGCYLKKEGLTLILLPGPPRECLPMFLNHVFHRLSDAQKTKEQWFKWRLFDVAESEIAHEMDAALKGLACQTGYRIEMPYVEVKVKCLPEYFKIIQPIMAPIVKPYIIADTTQTASEKLTEHLATLPYAITIIDEATGGFLQTLIQKPTTHTKVFFYPNSTSKVTFHLKGLSEYWEQQNAVTKKTTLSIDYDLLDQHHTETHERPYRSVLAVRAAAEWFSFRLFHLINQLH